MKLSIVLSTHAASFQAVAFKGDIEIHLERIASYGTTAWNWPFAIPNWRIRITYTNR